MPGHIWSNLLHRPWPRFDPDACVAEEVVYGVSVNGKLRGQLAVPADLDPEEIKRRALADEKAVRFIEGKTVKRVIFVPGRLVNIVV